MLSKYQNIFFLGVGGIGMSGLALWFAQNNYQVFGYDKTETPLTQSLATQNITVIYADEISLIPSHFEPNNTLVILTPAIPANHKQKKWFIDNGFTIKKRAEILGLIANPMYEIGVAGTHGKTTTSSMIAHILKECELDPTAFLGGITTNYGTNFLLSKNNLAAEKNFAVVEADEFDRSFLQLKPKIAVITSSDADHLDIYQNANSIENSYADFAALVEIFLLVHQGVSKKVLEKVQKNCKPIFYDIEIVQQNESQNLEIIQASNIRIENRKFVFDVTYLGNTFRDFELYQPGYHNVSNATAAIGVAFLIGLSSLQIKESLKNFRGVKRRFEFIFDKNNLVYIDDYAHHPTEITSFITSVRSLFPNLKITGIFQPHLFSRTRDFMRGFADSLALLDELLLMDIYPARELPIEGITSNALLEMVEIADKKLVNFDNIEKTLQAQEIQVLLTIGAGDIDRLVPRLKIFCEKIWNS